MNVSYRPQRIVRQFGFGQGSVMIAGEASFSSIGESEFISEGRNKILPYLITFS